MDTLPSAPGEALRLIWWSSLAVGVVVSAVVALLLWLIHRAAARIDGRVARVWDAGQRVAGNTAHIPTLYKTNAVAADILATAVRIDGGAAAIASHARGCPGCPQCMLKHS